MSQARRTRHFAFRASRKMPRSSRLAHKAPAPFGLVRRQNSYRNHGQKWVCPSHPFFRVVRKYSVYAVNFDPRLVYLAHY